MLQSFRFRLTLLFGLIAMAVVCALSWRLGVAVTAEALKARGQALDGVANGTAVMFAEGLHERMREVELLAGSHEAQRIGLDARGWMGEIERLRRGRPHYAWIGVTDAAGRVVAASDGLLVDRDVSARPWFKAAIKGPFAGDVHAAKLLQALLEPARAADDPLRFIDFAAPLRDGAGRTIGTLAVHADWRWAAEVIGMVRRPDLREAGIRVYVLDRSGAVLHQPADAESAVGLGRHPPLPRQPGLLDWPDGQRYLSVAVPMRSRSPLTDLGWTVLVREPEAQAMAGVLEAQRTVWQIGALAAAVMMIAAYALAARFAAPLQAIAAAAGRIEGGDLATRLPISEHSSELTTLSHALAGMVNRMVEREQALFEAKSELEGRVAERTAELAEANAALDRLAHEDALTGLPNRRAADTLLARQLALHRRQQKPLALLLVDIDHFKRVNDQFGHPVGDQVLRCVAGRLAAGLRASDAAARFGGEEFLVVLPDTDREGLVRVAEKLRGAIAAVPVAPVGAITASFGGALLQPGDELPALLQRADEALYAAKAGGRNRVVLEAEAETAEA